MARYRLRFLLQEFDLPRGATVVGRSLDCNITIEDPLVSRQHARIVVDDEGGRVEDLGSRNGVRVNGVLIRDPAVLGDGDRIRIGTQDFVFCRVGEVGQALSKTTGVLSLCANCRLPYPREVAACPQCEATEQTDEQTLSGLGKDSKIAWGVQLLVQALERALALGRLVDAERIVRRATAQVEELVASGAAVDDGALGALAVQAASTTLATNDPTWALWVIDIYRRVNRVPPLAVAESLGEVGVRHGAIVRPALEALLEHLDAQVRSSSHPQAHPHPQPQPQPDERGEALTRLAHLRRALAEAGLGTAEGAGSWSGRQGRS